ncbi:tRNA lysidine(34) synthetase TilS [Chlamydiifrater phoenicopteri]|uniref:tRNA lysidine(34) synthetase TilS n=1 Tax=Chlamydiifrater phoenicopteri TaxID=2681469 RepID=UPI001BCEEAFB|nr:tRNA lysidine(34) synthetase TilS [Chlamydiifrater phoenicopteri]
MHSAHFKDNQLELFFSSLDKKKRYLLALSGGSDSTFLFYVLISYRIPFAAAYVDHGWRDSSSLEAIQLQKLCKEYEVPFYCHRIDNAVWKGKDLENTARKVRYDFFLEVCRQEGLGGVFVGHHADDKVETILKRLFEGAGLTNLSGPKETSSMSSMPIIRPLLHLRKQDIEDKLQKANITYFFDETNSDEHFLRARMRKSIIPCLQKNFGKNIINPLLALAKDSDELAEYIDQESAVYLKGIFRAKGEVSITLPDALLGRAFLAKQVIKKFFIAEGIGVSRHTVLAIYQHLIQRTCKVTMRVHDKNVKICGNIVSVCEN